MRPIASEPARVRRRGHASAALLAICLGVAGSVVTASPALAATIVGASVEVLVDGTAHGTANECLVTDPDSSLADESPSDGIVCTEDSVTFGWDYSVAPDGAEDVVMSQTLPAGWAWDPISLTSCAGGADYTGVGVVSPDGLTLTCTLTFPVTGNARSGQIPVVAIPKAGVPDGAAYTPELVVADDGATTAHISAETVTVRSMPRWNLVKLGAAIDPATPGLRDFGAGLESSYRLLFYVSIEPVAAVNFKGQDLLAPFSFTDVVTGMSPVALLGSCLGSNMVISCTQAGGPGADVTVTSSSGLAAVLAPGNWAVAPLATALLTLGFDVPFSELPAYPLSKTWVNQVLGFDPTSPSGVSNLGPAVENGSEPGADCTVGNGNDNCARLVGTAPIPGVGPFTTFKSLRQVASTQLNCGNAWGWCQPLEGTTGTSANNNFAQGNQDGIAYRGDQFGAGFRFNWTTTATEIPENAQLCDVWDNSLQEFEPAGFPDHPAQTSYWLTVLEPIMHYTDQAFADDAARESADCGSYSTVNDGVWYDDWADVPGGPQSITGVRWTAPTARTFSFLQWLVPMKVSNAAPVGAVVPDFLHLYYDQAVTPQNPDGWSIVNRDSYRVNDLQILLDKDTVPTGQTGAVAGARVTYSLSVLASQTGASTGPRELAGAHVVDTLDRCMLEPQLSPAAATAWSMTVTTPPDVGPDDLACTSDDVSGAVLTFTPLAPVMSGAPVPVIEYSVLVSSLVGNGQQLTNTATVQVDQGVTLQPDSARTDEWQIVVAAPGAVRIAKAADFPVVEVEPDDLSWTIVFSNTLQGDLGLTEFIDILPRNGDPHGTDFHGAFGFSGAEVVVGDDLTVHYTTDPVATIQADPAVNTSTWTAAGSYTGDLADVTAIKLVAVDLLRGDVAAVRVHADPNGNHEGDVYRNQVAAGRVQGLGQAVPATLVSEIRVVASSVGDRVWHDENADGVQDPSEAGFEGVTVRLYDAGGALRATTTTGPDGSYSFSGYHSGDYRIVVDASTLPAGFAATYDLDSGTTAPDSDSAILILGADSDRDDVDFGYTRRHSAAVIALTGPAEPVTALLGAAFAFAAGTGLLLLARHRRRADSAGVVPVPSPDRSG